jgi:hypothetical protein
LSKGVTTEVMERSAVVGQASVKTIFPVIDPASGLLRVVWRVVPQEGVLLSGRYVSLASWLSVATAPVEDGQ